MKTKNKQENTANVMEKPDLLLGHLGCSISLSTLASEGTLLFPGVAPLGFYPGGCVSCGIGFLAFHSVRLGVVRDSSCMPTRMATLSRAVIPPHTSARNIPHSRNKMIGCSPGTPSGFAVVGNTSLGMLLDSLWILCATSTILVYKCSVCPDSFVVTIALVLVGRSLLAGKAAEVLVQLPAQECRTSTLSCWPYMGILCFCNLCSLLYWPFFQGNPRWGCACFLPCLPP